MSNKPKWTCASCGMYSSRRYSVKRHIQNLHSGGAFLVSFIDYVVGRQAGYYLPSFPPTYETKSEHNDIDYQKIIKEETLKGMIRKNLQNNLSK
jgi:hypothetical protein